MEFMESTDIEGATETATIQKLESLLLVSVPRDLMDDEVLRLRRQVLGKVRRHHSSWVLLDFSQVDICDSFYGRFIQSIAHMVRLAGAKVIVSGLADAVVETLVELGLTLADIFAVLDLDDALALSRESEELDDDLVFDQEISDLWSPSSDPFAPDLMRFDLDSGPPAQAEI
jgi:rsbT antagonist protein RsbS